MIFFYYMHNITIAVHDLLDTDGTTDFIVPTCYCIFNNIVREIRSYYTKLVGSVLLLNTSCYRCGLLEADGKISETLCEK
jgi:hypothetical protein